MCTCVHGSPQKEGSHAVEGLDLDNISIVLNSFMLVTNPSHIFREDFDPLAEQLKEQALKLVKCFEFIINEFKWVIDSGGYHNQYISNRNSSATQKFVRILYEYHHKFNDWKIPDEVKLVASIMPALSALYNASETILDDTSENSRLFGEFTTQINYLTGKLIQIGGREKLKEFVENMMKNH